MNPPLILNTHKGFYILTDEPTFRRIGPFESREAVRVELEKLK